MTIDEEPNYSRFGVFGDLPTKATIWLLETFPQMPWIVEAGFLYSSSLAVLILAKQQRRAIRANLAVIHKNLGFWESYYRVFQVFCHFGWTYIDGRRVRLGQRVVTWELEGQEIFEEIRDSEDAGIILTTHTGSYDLAGTLFAAEFERTLHTVRLVERSEHLRELREKELAQDCEKYPNFKIHYNSEHSMLGVELAKLLSNGQLLALQGDRVIGTVAPMEVPLPGRSDVSLRIPKGPMTLACFSKSPCYPLFVVRDRHRHYRVIFEPALEISSEGRKIKESDVAKPWVSQLMQFLRGHSNQWFVFEEAFSRKK